MLSIPTAPTNKPSNLACFNRFSKTSVNVPSRDFFLFGTFRSECFRKLETDCKRLRNISSKYDIIADFVVKVAHAFCGVAHPEFDKALRAKRVAKMCIPKSPKCVEATVVDFESFKQRVKFSS